MGVRASKVCHTQKFTVSRSSFFFRVAFSFGSCRRSRDDLVPPARKKQPTNLPRTFSVRYPFPRISTATVVKEILMNVRRKILYFRQVAFLCFPSATRRLIHLYHPYNSRGWERAKRVELQNKYMALVCFFLGRDKNFLANFVKITN